MSVGCYSASPTLFSLYIFRKFAVSLLYEKNHLTFYLNPFMCIHSK